LVLIIAGTVGWYSMARIGDARVVGKLEAEITKRGEPLGLSELARAYPPVPDEENAAIALLDVWEKEDEPRWSAFRQQKRLLPGASEVKFDTDLPYLGETKFIAGQQLTDESREAVNRFLSERAGHIAAVRAAIRRPRSRFPIALEDGPAVLLLPHLGPIKTEAQSLRLVALMARSRTTGVRHLRRWKTSFASPTRWPRNPSRSVSCFGRQCWRLPSVERKICYAAGRCPLTSLTA